ncbi:alpha/beta hydrolase [Alteromonas sp. H39]|uniref:alpha/beta hydrolase n=1 Tax=Alteromonas sp. H39 TaxID=3389876 RepID=UPI0039DF9954
MSHLTKFFFALFLSLIITGCAIDVSPRSFVYQAKAKAPLDTTGLHAAANKDEISIGITTVEMTNAQGLTLTGVAVNYPEPVANIVFFGGNGMSISQANGYLHRLGQLPANILWIDYQGMGASDKAAQIEIDNLKQDALQVFDYAKEVFPQDLPTIVHGLSMGSLIATFVATEREVSGLVLEGAINGVPDLVDNMIPIWSKLFTNVNLHPKLAEIDNGVLLEQYKGPLLLIVGEKDRTTPVKFTEQLYRLSPSDNKSMYIAPDADHGTTMKKPGTIKKYRDFVASF